MRIPLHGPFGPILTGLLVAIATTGCKAAASPDPFVDTPSPDAAFDVTQRLPNEIDHDEIVSRGRNQLTAMALIRRLRPGWLRARGQTSLTNGAASYPVVYIDEIRHGGLPTLSRIPTSEILRLEYYNTSDATTRWGTGHTAGVINIVTGRF